MVDVGVAGVGGVLAVAVPCEVLVADVVGTLGELGVITVELVALDPPVAPPVAVPVAGGVVRVVSSAKERLAAVVVASMVALTMSSL